MCRRGNRAPTKGVWGTSGGGANRGGGGGANAQLWVSVKFGDNNVVIISPYLVQVVEPRSFLQLGIDPDKFKGFAIKSRVHFHRGFTDSGYCKAFYIVEPDQPFPGTVRLEARDYKHLPRNKFYPYNKNATFTVKGPGKLSDYPGRD